MRELRERSPDSPDLAEQPEPPERPSTDEHRLEGFFAYALQEIEPGLRDDLDGVRAQLEATRERWLAIHDDPNEALLWLRVLGEDALRRLRGRDRARRG